MTEARTVAEAYSSAGNTSYLTVKADHRSDADVLIASGWTPGLLGGVLMLGLRTSQFGVRKMSEFIDFLHATAAARDVDLRYREYAEC